MSQHRIAPEAGWAKPDGKCRWCKREGLGKRATFCSDECVHQHKLRTQPGYVRHHVERRDKGVCAACGIDTVAFRKSMGESRYRRTKQENDLLVAAGFSIHAYQAGDFWQADHIVEVVKGGGGCGLENYQTLCTPCHKAKTRALVAERAEERRLAKEKAKASLFAGIES